jgi:DNA-binding CsgD family transcriptional regulator/GAF domain-containing protein
MRSHREKKKDDMTQQRDALSATALDLIAKVYEAAAEGAWSSFQDAMAIATASEGAVLWLHDLADRCARFEDSETSFVCNVRMAPEFLDSYTQHYTHTNVLLKEIGAQPEGAVLVSSAVIRDADFHRTEFYCDWLRPQGIGYCLGGPVLKRDGVVSMFSMQRPESHGPFRDTDLHLLALVMPHLRRACLLHKRLSRLQAQRSEALVALELLPTAVWLLDAKGQLLLANRAGRELNSRRDGLWLDGSGRPAATDPALHCKLRLAINGAIAAGQGLAVGFECSFYVRRSTSPKPLQISVYPLKHDGLIDRIAAVMFITDEARAALPASEVSRLIYGLTRTEARLATHLARGGSLSDYCVENAISANTARTHLKHVFDKTGTHRQSQLVSLLTR